MSEQKLTRAVWESKESCSPELLFQIVRGVSRTWDVTRAIGSVISMIGRRPNGIMVIGGDDELALNEEGIRTAYTDYRTIAFTSKFLDKLTPLGALFTLLHEGCHVALLHGARMQKRNPELWNIATDTLINYIVARLILPEITGIKNITGDKLFIPGVDPMIIGFTDKTSGWIIEPDEEAALKAKVKGLNIFDKDKKRISEEGFYTMLDDLQRLLVKKAEDEQKQKQQGQGQGQSSQQPGQQGQGQSGQQGQGQQPGQDQGGKAGQQPGQAGQGQPQPGQGGQQPGQQSQGGQQQGQGDGQSGQPGQQGSDGGGQGQPGQGQPGQGGGQGGQAPGVAMPGANELLDHHQINKTLRERLEKAGKKDLADRLGLPENDGVNGELNERMINDETRDFVNRARGMVERSLRAREGGSGIGDHIDSWISESIESDESNRNGAKINWDIFVANIVESAVRGRWGEDRQNCDELSVLSRDPISQGELGLDGEFYRYGYERKAGQAKVLVIWDSSGSVQTNELEQFHHELRGLVSGSMQTGNHPFIELDLMTADTAVRTIETYLIKCEDDLPKLINIGGRGGTDMFTPFVQALLRTEKPYDLALILSDGEYRYFSHGEVYKAISAIDESKAGEIPPLAVINSRDSFCNDDQKKALDTFQNEGRGGMAFNLKKLDYDQEYVTVDDDGIASGQKY